MNALFQSPAWPQTSQNTEDAPKASQVSYSVTCMIFSCAPMPQVLTGIYYQLHGFSGWMFLGFLSVTQYCQDVQTKNANKNINDPSPKQDTLQSSWISCRWEASLWRWHWYVFTNTVPATHIPSRLPETQSSRQLTSFQRLQFKALTNRGGKGKRKKIHQIEARNFRVTILVYRYNIFQEWHKIINNHIEKSVSFVPWAWLFDNLH